MKKQILLIASYLIFTNLFFAVVSYYLGLNRPLINLDYLIVLIFCCSTRNILLSNVLLILSLFLIYSIDLILLILQIFPFVNFNDLIYLSNFIFNAPILYRISLLGMIVIFFIYFFIIRDIVFKKININYYQYLILILICSIALLTSNSITSSIESVKQIQYRFFNSQLIFFIENEQSSFLKFNHNKNLLGPSPYQAATQPLRAKIILKKKLSNKILVIVNESWGQTLYKDQQEAILKPIYQKKSKLDFIEQGGFSVVGATVAGEIRELCHKRPLALDLKYINAHELQDCLPNQLKNLGYQTYAFHGAKSMMYERDSWYPKIGFKHIFFFDQLPKAGLCYSFEGRCDVKMLPYIKYSLQHSPKSFVYWLTLNTHAPYEDKIFYKGLNCKAVGIKETTETCGNYKLQYQFFYSLSQLIDDPSMKGVEVYIAGDHSPPIINMMSNLLSFKGSEIAWIHFKIKEETN